MLILLLVRGGRLRVLWWVGRRIWRLFKNIYLKNKMLIAQARMQLAEF